jgi:hypothetical protein
MMRMAALAALVACGGGGRTPAPGPIAYKPYEGASPMTGHAVLFVVDLPGPCAATDRRCRDQYLRPPILGKWASEREALRNPDTPVAPTPLALVVEFPLASPLEFELRAAAADGFRRRELFERVAQIYEHLVRTPGFDVQERALERFELLWVRLVEDEGRTTAWPELKRVRDRPSVRR